MKVASEWEDYEIIDMANGEKLERWKDVVLVRPDPQIIWKNKTFPARWKEADAIYKRSNTGGGAWQYNKKIPSSWQVHYKNLTFNIKPMGFKHTGLFPEQAVNWDWMIAKIKEENAKRILSDNGNSKDKNVGKIENEIPKKVEQEKEIENKIAKKIEQEKENDCCVKVLNLFAYTGGATVACLSAGASVVHVDSSKGMTEWAKENVAASGLKDKPVRFLVDDVIKFVNREIRRGNKYDAIIMDPPSYGRGKNGEVWKFEENIEELIELCMQVLSDNPLFFLINSYTTGISAQVLENILIEKFEKRLKNESKNNLEKSSGKEINDYKSDYKIKSKNEINGGTECERKSDERKLQKEMFGKFEHGEVGLPMTNSKMILPCGIYARWEKV